MFEPLTYFGKFKKFVGAKVYYLLCLMLVVGFFEGLGITLFLPILQNGFGTDKISHILKAVFGFFHLSYSFQGLLLAILVLFLIRSVFLIYYASFSGKLIAALTISLRNKAVNAIFAADYLYLIKKEVGYINNVLVREIAGVVDAFNQFSQILKYLVYAVVYVILSLLLNFKLTIIILSSGFLILFFTKKFNALLNKTSIRLSKAYGDFHSILFQALTKLKYLKSTASYNSIGRTVDKRSRDLSWLGYRLSFLQAVANESLEPVVVFVVIALFFYYVVMLGRQVNEVIFLAFLFLQITRQLVTVQQSYRKFLAARGSMTVYAAFEAELEKNREDLNINGMRSDFDKEIRFEDVSLIFPNGKAGLDRINVAIKPRTVVAFVGHSGSGKSTVANMLTGIIRPTSGEISFGGVPYSGINLKHLRENIGYVTQEDVIFNASIKDNITLWDEALGRDRLARIIKMTHMDGFIKGLPQKEGAMLGDNGLDVSGGQRQRITIARELYKNARFLILDEATSALDSEFEREIYENLKELKGEKTIVVIAHRLSTIKNADYIYVLDEGRIIEEGTFDALYKDTATKFYRICRLQSLSGELK